jgi:hypothetical protein
MGGAREPGVPGKYNPDTLGLIVLEDPRAGAASPMVALPAMPRLAPRTTESYNNPTTLSPCQGPVPTTSVPVVPFGAPTTLEISIANTTTGRQRATRTDEARLLLPRHHFLSQGKRYWKWEHRKPVINTMRISRGHRQEGPKVSLLG